MRKFTEEELTQAIVDAFDAGALKGVSWGMLDELPHIDYRRGVANSSCLSILLKVASKK